MMVTTLTLSRSLGRRLRVMVVTPNRPRRRRIARAMRAAGWSLGRISAALRIPAGRIEPMLAGPRLFDEAMLAAIRTEQRRMERVA